MSKSTSRTRRSPQQWQQLVDQWRSSGLSAAKFCVQQQIAYSTFQAWRHRLKRQSCVMTEDERNAPFIDLSELSPARCEQWRITLRLGHGVELELSQG